MIQFQVVQKNCGLFGGWLLQRVIATFQFYPDTTHSITDPLLSLEGVGLRLARSTTEITPRGSVVLTGGSFLEVSLPLTAFEAREKVFQIQMVEGDKVLAERQLEIF